MHAGTPRHYLKRLCLCRLQVLREHQDRINSEAASPLCYSKDFVVLRGEAGGVVIPHRFILA